MPASGFTTASGTALLTQYSVSSTKFAPKLTALQLGLPPRSTEEHQVQTCLT